MDCAYNPRSIHCSLFVTMTRLLYALTLLLSLVTTAYAAPPATFAEAKVVAKQKVYFDQGNSATGDLYCGCQ